MLKLFLATLAGLGLALGIIAIIAQAWPLAVAAGLLTLSAAGGALLFEREDRNKAAIRFIIKGLSEADIKQLIEALEALSSQERH